MRDADPQHVQTVSQRPDMSPLESKLAAQAYEHLNLPHNKAKFDALSEPQQGCLAGAAMCAATHMAGNPKLNSQDIKSIFLSENGNMYLGMGKLNIPVDKVDIAEAVHTPLAQSLDHSRQANQDLLNRQAQQDLARNQGGPSIG